MPPIVEIPARSENPLVEIGARLRLSEHLRFLREFARDPRATGAIAPSSPLLAEAMIRDLGLETAGHVVELGAGTGAFTAAIAERLPESARFMAMELNPRLAAALRGSFDRDVRVVCASAANLCRRLGRRSVGRVDAIVSGLPWACIAAREQRAILQEIRRALRPGGWFTTFAYVHAAWLPSGLKFRREVRQAFPRTEVLPIVWRNMPPAFIYRCTN
jgi:phosphatidylethanolamine/phosphatidyl-N-methylethanolamine N-methyltransferase